MRPGIRLPRVPSDPEGLRRWMRDLWKGRPDLRGREALLRAVPFELQPRAEALLNGTGTAPVSRSRPPAWLLELFDLVEVAP